MTDSSVRTTAFEPVRRGGEEEWEEGGSDAASGNRGRER